jgi:hypothetical protein
MQESITHKNINIRFKLVFIIALLSFKIDRRLGESAVNELIRFALLLIDYSAFSSLLA